MTSDTIIVSLTTHSIRVAQVTRTAIFSIIKNTYKDVHIVLTLYKDDVKLIPDDLQLFIDNELVELIVADKDLGPHLKYFYVMQKYRENTVITIDDDILYPETMIEEMVNAYKKYNCIIGRRCFEIKSNMNYHNWIKTGLSQIKEPTHKNFATGVGGILYPPNCLDLSDYNVKEILTIKYDDDFYLKALEVRKDLKIMSIIYNGNLLFMKNLKDSYTQSIGLWNSNVHKANDGIKLFESEFRKCL